MAKPQTVSFISKFTELELVRQPSNDVPVASGIGWVSQTKGVRYKFYPTLAEDGSGLVGRLDVKVGQDKMLDTTGWLAPDADNSIERDAADALRVHKEFGAGRDFWLMSVPMAEVRRQIRKASVDLDEDALVGLLDREGAENNRREVITEAQDALDLVREAKASLQAQAAAAEAEQEKPKAKAKPKAAAVA